MSMSFWWLRKDRAVELLEDLGALLGGVAGEAEAVGDGARLKVEEALVDVDGRADELVLRDALDLDAWTALFADAGLAVEDVYMDQWLRQRLRKALRGWRTPDLTVDEPIATPWIPIPTCCWPWRGC